MKSLINFILESSSTRLKVDEILKNIYNSKEQITFKYFELPEEIEKTVDGSITDIIYRKDKKINYVTIELNTEIFGNKKYRGYIEIEDILHKGKIYFIHLYNENRTMINGGEGHGGIKYEIPIK